VVGVARATHPPEGLPKPSASGIAHGVRMTTARSARALARTR
jgi:hypothetical protein